MYTLCIIGRFIKNFIAVVATYSEILANQRKKK